MDIDPGQVTAVAGQTLHTVAGLSPMAQIAAVVMLGAVGLAWVGKSYIPLLQARKPDGGLGHDDVKSILDALIEFATVVQRAVEHSEEVAKDNKRVVEQSERTVEYIAVVAGSMSKTVELMILLIGEIPGIDHKRTERIFRELEESKAALSAHSKRPAA